MPTSEEVCIGIFQATEVRLVGGVQKVRGCNTDGTEFATDTMDLEKAYLQGRFDAIPYIL